ncbi:hypothetical protein NDU88_009002 [Pleurodeles waltl]|uniref:Uncharacterized protein n=1 Tax=Pleurodeles waltl TaxID=8319 RepID=A0AAV7QSD2_PLEWA|nr:hypothetical protein NDU88_009002 [Pleurodeles waltl]
MVETPGQLKSRKSQAEARLKRRHVQNARMSRKRRACTRQLRIGEVVLMKNRCHAGKFKTTFESGLWTVTRVKGTLVTVTRGPEVVTRNISWFKAYHGEHPFCQRNRKDKSREREDEDFEGSDVFNESGLKNSPTPTRDDRREKEVAPMRAPTQIEEDQPAEVQVEEDSREVIQGRGRGRYYLRSRLSPPERLKDYVCE